MKSHVTKEREWKMGKLLNYPVPKGAVLQKDFVVRARSAGEKEWQDISCYQVKVDMHEVSEASMAYFDFTGEAEVEITYPGVFFIYRADVRPLSAKVEYSFDSKTVRLKLKHPVKLSIEINKGRHHNLHLFAGEIMEQEPDISGENILYLSGNLKRTSIHRTEELMYKVEKMPLGRTIYFAPGVHYLEECTMRIPSDTSVYLAGGAVVVGTFIVSRARNVRIYGRGCLYLAGFERFSGLNGIRLSHSSNVRIEGIHLINPPHYSVYIGDSENVLVEDISSFSCEGWSDGIDMRSRRNVTVRNCFLRTSDDCIAIYGRRWDYNGDTKNILVTGCSLWADVAHPTMIGTHGDYENEGNILENIRFENLDILEHNEYQAEYLGCLAINAGDKNVVRNVSYEDIRIEHIEHGKILDIQVKFNPDYNPACGRQIERIFLKNIFYMGSGEETSVIKGYNDEYRVSDVVIESLYICGKRVQTWEEANIEVGDFTDRIELR